MFQIFLSYARDDEQEARLLYDHLVDKGFNVWFDKEALLPGQNWQLEIEETIRNSSIFIALLSSNSISKTGFVQKELKLGFNALDEKPFGDVYIIPVRLDDVLPRDPRLKAIQWVDLFPTWDSGLSKLFGALDNKLKSNKTKRKPAYSRSAASEVTILKKSQALGDLFQKRFSVSGLRRFIRWQRLDIDLIKRIESQLSQQSANWTKVAKILGSAGIVDSKFLSRLDYTTTEANLGMAGMDKEISEVARIWSCDTVYTPYPSPRVPTAITISPEWFPQGEGLVNSLRQEGIAVLSDFQNRLAPEARGPDLFHYIHIRDEACVEIYFLQEEWLQSKWLMDRLRSISKTWQHHDLLDSTKTFQTVVSLGNFETPKFLVHIPTIQWQSKEVPQLSDIMSQIIDQFELLDSVQLKQFNFAKQIQC